MPYGLFPAGFVPATIEDLVSDLGDALKAAFGESIKLGDKDVFGQIVGVVSERLATLWEATEAVNSSQDPDSATGAQLDALCALTGTTRDVAEASTVTLSLTGTPTTVVALGSEASVTGTAAVFVTDAEATITALTAWAITTAYVIGDRRTNAARAYVCITAGTSAGSGGPTTTADDITDNGAHWRYIGEGTGATDVAATCNVTGAIVAASGGIITIDTPIGGWDSVKNLLDATLGNDVETDEDLRLRRVVELAKAGAGTHPAIYEAVSDVDNVVGLRVFVNDTDLTLDGMSPHSVEVNVRGGDDDDIWIAMYESVCAGIAMIGTEQQYVDKGYGSRLINFNRPTEIDIYVTITLAFESAVYAWATDGDDQVKAAIVAFGDAQTTGKDAVSASILAQAFKVLGVLDVTSCLIGIAPTPTLSTTINIDLRELAVFDTSRIIVSASSGGAP